MTHEPKTPETSGGIKTSKLTQINKLTLKTGWIEVCRDVRNLETLKKRFPQDKNVQEKLTVKKELRQSYETELQKRRKC